MSDIKSFFKERAKNINDFDFWRYGENLGKKCDDYEVSWISKNANISEKDIVVDLGCGTGYHSLKLSYICKKVLSFDFEKKYIDILNKKIKEKSVNNIFTKCLDIKKFKEINIANKILCNGVIQYLYTEKNLIDFFECLHASLLKDGMVIIKHPVSIIGANYIKEKENYKSNCYSIGTIIASSKDYFNLVHYEYTYDNVKNNFTKEEINIIENTKTTRQAWIVLKKR